MSGNWTTAGSGDFVSGTEPVEGTVVEISTTEDVLPLFDDCPSDLIVLLHTSGGTILSPLFSDIKGVISTVGGKGSHVAILSREFGIPCVMGTELSGEGLHGRHVRIETDGSVQVAG
ncbi:PEP-utilizing enzyme [Tsukamurella soli]|uniref:PEP-utilising enzyme mobile domain-containing protein n=1 Tax=Tsukamurella soli TaxID=644556 RepID=A0ABP8J9M2_9ACTN